MTRPILKQAEQWPFRCGADEPPAPPAPPGPPKVPTAPAPTAPAPAASAPGSSPAKPPTAPAAPGGATPAKPPSPSGPASSGPFSSGPQLITPAEGAIGMNALAKDYVGIMAPMSGAGGSATSPLGSPSSPSSPSTGGPGAPVSYTPAAGVDQWTPQIEESLRRNGLPTTPDYVNRVKKQMGTESSGDPKAINRVDSNAIAGHPSQGLMQTIPSTFQQYHLPGDSSDITDPQANLDAAINYGLHTYGPTLMNSQGGGIGSGHGY